jgi:hypothetical protein
MRLQGDDCTENNRVWILRLYTLEKTKLNAMCTFVIMELTSPVVMKFGGISCLHFQGKYDNSSVMYHSTELRVNTPQAIALLINLCLIKFRIVDSLASQYISFNFK